MNDFRYAFRQLIKAPGFSGVVILTLAVAIGVNSAIFSVVDDILLRPIVPLRPKEVVNIFTARKEANRDYRQFSYSEFATLREPNPIFSDVAALGFTMTGIGRGESLHRSFAFFSSENLFDLLGVKPAAGRFYNSAEARPNANLPVVVASYQFWRSMGGRPDFVGSTLDVNGQPFTVIGITPEGFSGISAMIVPDVWLPLGVYGHGRFNSPFANDGSSADLASTTTFALNLMGRFRPGIELRSSIRLLPVLERRLDSIDASKGSERRELLLQPPSRVGLSSNPSEDGPFVAIAVLLMAMAAVVLLIASLNVANMMLARGTVRRHEIAVRLSLGASRWRIIRQLVAEGLLLSLLAGGTGLLLAQWSGEFLANSLNSLFRSMNLSSGIDLRPDAIVLVVTAIFCVAATLVYSVLPAIRSVGVDIVGSLKQQADRPPSVPAWRRCFSGRDLLAMAQVALSLVLLFAGGLFLRGALNASDLNLGFSTSGGIVAEIDYSLSHTSDVVARQKMEAILGRVNELPGVRQAALATLLPYMNMMIVRRVMPAEGPPVTDPKAPKPGFDGVFSAVSPGYFDSMGVRFLQGRTFTTSEEENPNSPPVVILDEQMAKSLFPGGQALGGHIRLNRLSDGVLTTLEVVGIVTPHRQQPGTDMPHPRVFVPLAQYNTAPTYLELSLSSNDPRLALAAVEPLRRELLAIDPNLPLVQLRTYSQVVSSNLNLWVVRLGAIMFGIFGAIALLLAAVGVYGVKAYAVARRSREIGIRMALGARSIDVLKLIMGQALAQTAIALLAGSIFALLAGRLLASILFKVSPTDMLVLGTSAAILASTALLASLTPARKAIRVNPVEALRIE